MDFNGIPQEINGNHKESFSSPWNGAVLKSPGPRIAKNATKSFTGASRNLHGISLSFSEKPASGSGARNPIIRSDLHGSQHLSIGIQKKRDTATVTKKYKK